jgi:hypothetical protein
MVPHGEDFVPQPADFEPHPAVALFPATVFAAFSPQGCPQGVAAPACGVGRDLSGPAKACSMVITFALSASASGCQTAASAGVAGMMRATVKIN